MSIKAMVQLHVMCPCCTEKVWRVDQLSVNQSTKWTCEECHNQVRIKRVSESEFELEPTGYRETPVTVTLRSQTVPPITVRLNTWKYAHSQDDSPKEYKDSQRYFYNEHTCPTNWLRDVEEIEFKGDKDPHGVFEFVSVVDGQGTGTVHGDRNENLNPMFMSEYTDFDGTCAVSEGVKGAYVPRSPKPIWNTMKLRDRRAWVHQMKLARLVARIWRAWRLNEARG